MEVKAKAPGKIILAGEHAVVHGSTAVAAAINLYTYASVRLPYQSEDEGTLKLQLRDMALEFSWSLARIQAALSVSETPCAAAPSSCSGESLKSIAVLIEEQNIPASQISLVSGVSAFLWLYTCILGFKPATVVISSELPLGAGLGSSASFCVALSAAFLAISDAVNLDKDREGWFGFGEKELELLNKWAFEGEKIIHGKPSGLDNTVSTYGNMIKFKSGDLTRIKSDIPLKMLITNTKVGRNTKALVAGVSERVQKHPDAMASVFNAVNSISEELAVLIQSPGESGVSVTGKEEKIAELMEMNQGLLQCMGVSHASIETVLRTTLNFKLTSKLTGAGGGGCVLTLLPTLTSGTVVEKAVAELESECFQCLRAEIGGHGVQICFG